MKNVYISLFILSLALCSINADNLDSGVNKIYDSNLPGASESAILHPGNQNNATIYRHTLLINSSGITRPIQNLGDSVSIRHSNSKSDLDSALYKLDAKTEIQPYFYAYPPFPLPAMNQVRSKIYWDRNIDIDKDEINVFNINGNKVAGKEKISIEKIDDWSGYLSWDCNGMESGVYLIIVKHGTGNNVIKVIVSR